MNIPFSLHSFLRPAAALAAATLLLATSCTAPRAIVATGKVTPQGEFRVGYNQGFNIATAPLSKAGAAVRDAATTAANKDTVGYGGSVKNLQAAALAYILDPVQPTADLSIRYGILPRLDAGYKYAFGSHVFDAQFQLLGPTGSPENPGAGAASGTTYASIGLQFATQRAKLPSIPFLGDINSVLNFKATRNDLLVPLIFSQSFGPEEEIGAISYGVVYAHSWVNYGFAPDNVYLNTQKIPALPNQSRDFSSYGAFLNVKLGYRYVYVIPAVSIFYQNYGEYALLNGASTSLSGVTFVPSLGFQLRIPTK
ncbi:hypothetical protein Q3A66_12985 [Hymenobacter sp. BT770]|uniref:hypothetical protein n=1 Tax=Hymenobacter sp. BT770 TaxID=2886942 RepID=UPI001D12920E|nr:hypothetical protein [Hymenobacter sp. BT770]MCC3153836.1 hypothetical protein [Hymenobacter sp. BT770]MDO3415980.1 hypothetical protein [Hymenobacter sp. BT770]